MHAVVGLPVGPHLLWVVPIFMFLLVFSAGVAMLAAVGQVYFRDLGNLIPYFLRIWLYLSPVLYYANEVPDRLKPILYLNPLFPMLAALSDVATQSKTPSPGLLLLSLAWAIAAFVVGALLFISREREFAVRL
jgi:teichoic acid transport system permease protein